MTLASFNVKAEIDTTNFEHEYLLFPFLHLEIQTGKESHDENGHGHSDFSFEYGFDMTYSMAYKKLRLINEVFVSDHEIDIERLQFGYELSDTSVLWIGRFHVPIGYWNAQYHHSLHLQTSVHRPAILEFEDEGGPLSNHMTGFLMSNNYLFNDGNIGFHLALGTAPMLDEKLVSWGTSDKKDQHKLKTSGLIYWQPDELDPTQYGLSLGYSEIQSTNTNLGLINQTVVSVYSHNDWQAVRLTSEAYYVNNNPSKKTNFSNDSFSAVYAHLEYDFLPKWTIYGRIERGIDTNNNSYLSTLGHDSLDRNLVGVRYDFTRRQAFSCEIPQLDFGHDAQTHMSIQWTGMFP